MDQLYSDPGWGTADERVWITTRSVLRCIHLVTIVQDKKLMVHYTQAVTTQLSNDFTQVISDGIGAPNSNNGRAELVSVFTYYAQVGYLAENGGIIRATNGKLSIWLHWCVGRWY